MEDFSPPVGKIRLPNLECLTIDGINGDFQRSLIDSLLDCCTSGKLRLIRCSLIVSESNNNLTNLEAIDKISKLAELNGPDITLRMRTVSIPPLNHSSAENSLTASITSLYIPLFGERRHRDWKDGILSSLRLQHLESISNILYDDVPPLLDSNFGICALQSLKFLVFSFCYLDYQACVKSLRIIPSLVQLKYFTIERVSVEVSLDAHNDMCLLLRLILGLLEDSSDELCKATEILHDSQHPHHLLMSSLFNGNPVEAFCSLDDSCLDLAEVAFFESLFFLIATEMKNLEELSILSDAYGHTIRTVPAVFFLTRFLSGHFSFQSKLKQVIWKTTLLLPGTTHTAKINSPPRFQSQGTHTCMSGRLRICGTVLIHSVLCMIRIDSRSLQMRGKSAAVQGRIRTIISADFLLRVSISMLKMTCEYRPSLSNLFFLMICSGARQTTNSNGSKSKGMLICGHCSL